MRLSHASHSGFLSLEQLEPRIAPATLVVGGAVTYGESPFVGTDDPGANPEIATLFDSSADHYYIRLTKGDSVLFDADGDPETAAVPWIEIKSGNAYAFFYDTNGDHEVSQDELTGLSLGGVSSAKVFGSINGSVATNTDASGAFHGELTPGPANYISSLTVTGSISGGIASGGKVTNVTIGGSVLEITAGSGVSQGSTINFSGVDGIGSFFPTYNPAVGEVGASISKVTAGLSIGTIISGVGGDFAVGGAISEISAPLVGSLIAGAGGFAKAGGSITKITVGHVDVVWGGDGGVSGAGGSVSDIMVTASLGSTSIMAGHGGAGDETSVDGGAGGSASNIKIWVSSNATVSGIFVLGADGAEGFQLDSSTIGIGGAGGSVSNVTIGVVKSGGEWVPAETPVLSSISIAAGNGAAGKNGGAGGDVKNVQAITLDNTISISAGGGASPLDVAGASGGDGGDISKVVAISVATSGAGLGGVTFQAGNGGENGLGAGGDGGSISDVTTAGYAVSLTSGFGGNGIKGGNAGSVTKVTAASKIAATGSLTIFTGQGGESYAETNGIGGNGGSISGITVSNSAYAQSLLPSALLVPSYIGDGSDLLVDQTTGGLDLTGAFDSVEVDAAVYGHISLDHAAVAGDLILNGTLFGRIILHEDTTIAGDIILNGYAGEGVFLRVTSTDPDTGEEVVDYISYADNPAAFAGVLGGDVTDAGVDAPIAGWQVASPSISLTTYVSGYSTGKDGKAGSITNVKGENAVPEIFRALTADTDVNWGFEAGGAGGGSYSSGHAGGGVSGVSMTGFATLGTLNVSFVGGVGSYAAETGAGGAGGSISKILISADTGDTAAAFSFQAGEGGQAGMEKSGGNGGSLSGIDLAVAQGSSLTFTAGNGGEGNDKVGSGGNVSAIDINTNNTSREGTTSVNVYAGSAANPGEFLGGDGGSITGVSISAHNASAEMFAGEGQVSGNGGSIAGITITANLSALILQGGAGGAGEASSINGGAGGSVSGVSVIGGGGEQTDGGLVLIQGGAGGAGYFGDIKVGNGGDGGALSKITIGARKVGGEWLPTLTPFLFGFTATGGEGGEGWIAGAGGKIDNVRVITSDSAIKMEAGKGGEAPFEQGTKGGIGGSVTNVTAISIATDTSNDSSVLLKYGVGGSGKNAPNGVAGNVSKVEVGGSKVTLLAGQNTGGLMLKSGGSVTDVSVTSSLTRTGLLQIWSGLGQYSESGPGGAGGSIKNVEISNSAYIQALLASSPESIERWQLVATDLEFFTLPGGGGGTKGGDGGSISAITYEHTVPSAYRDLLSPHTDAASLVMAAAPGSLGDTAGGNGGSISGVKINGIAGISLGELTLAAGNGQWAAQTGSGGAGGSVKQVQVSLETHDAPGGSSAVTITGGDAGSGQGAGAGGSGGSVSDISLKLGAANNIGIVAGNAGDSQTGMVGAGGSISKIAIAHDNGDSGSPSNIEIYAGNSGGSDADENTKSGVNGGSISDLSFDVHNASIHLEAGDGGFGGAGGSVSGISSSASAVASGTPGIYNLNPSNFSLEASGGRGSEGATKSGQGGSVKDVKLVAPDSEHSFSFTAGDGDSGGNPGAGGTVEKISILDTTSATVIEGGKAKKVNARIDYVAKPTLGEVSIVTGHGGDNSLEGPGANGGDAKNVTWAPWNMDFVSALARSLTLGSGGAFSSQPGQNGKPINVDIIPA